MALLGLLMREILVKQMSFFDRLLCRSSAGKVIYYLYHKGYEGEGFPLFSLPRFFLCL